MLPGNTEEISKGGHVCHQDWNVTERTARFHNEQETLHQSGKYEVPPSSAVEEFTSFVKIKTPTTMWKYLDKHKRPVI